MLANVATMVGLLGTISGLITSFKAVSKADAALKRQFLSSSRESLERDIVRSGSCDSCDGIFLILSGRQNQLIEQTTEKCGKLTEILTSSRYSN